MDPFDPIEDDDEIGLPDIPMSRRTFLGSVGATTFATAVRASDPTHCDETALQFAWSNDPAAGGARVLDVSIITRTKSETRPDTANEEDAEDPQEDEPKPIISEFGSFTEEGTTIEADGWFWRIRPESFGPQAYFALKTFRNKGLLRYELRVADVSYGRLKPAGTRRRSITFIFQQIIVAEECDGEMRDIKRFELSASTDIWSSENGPNTTKTFVMSGAIENNKRKRVLFRDFIQNKGTEHALYIDVPLRRITNTTALMFNALITRQPGKSNPTVDLWFLNNGRWRVKSSTGGIAAFNGRVPLSELDVFWPNVKTKEERVTAEAPLFAIGTPADDASRIFSIGRGKDAPGFSGTWEDASPNVYFRAQRPREEEVNERDTVRAEAMLQSEWESVSFPGQSLDQNVQNLPRLFGAVLERVDHADKLDNAYPATKAGSISFQARYGGREDASASDKLTGLLTPLGKFTATGIRDTDVVSEEGDFSFPKRRGWPVTALFNWPSKLKSGRRGTRNDPLTQLIDAEIAILEAGIALPGAEYSRLSFDPTALRIYYSQLALERPPLGSFLNLAPQHGVEFARIDLARAKLRASRSQSLLSLKFGFSDLALSFRDKAIEFVSYNTACDLTTRPGDFGALQPHDTRPTLVVEFPPQHLFEEAKFYQTTPPLPDVQLKLKLTVTRAEGTVAALPYDGTPPPYSVNEDTIVLDSDNRMHLTDALNALKEKNGTEAVTKFREDLRTLKSGTEENPDAPKRRFRSFLKKLADEMAKKKHPSDAPADQFIYVGPVAMDIDVRQFAHSVNEILWAEEASNAVSGILEQAAANAAKLPAPKNFEDALTIASRVEGMMPTYQRFRDYWREQMVSLLFAPATADDLVKKALANTPPTSSAVAQIEHIPMPFGSFADKAKDVPKPEIFAARLKAVSAAFAKNLFQREDLEKPSRARLSNPSRLAFRVNCRDGLDEIRTNGAYDLDAPEDAVQRLPRENLPFHLDTLTHFRGMELSVTARAEIVYEPGQLGLIAPRRPRIADTSGDAMLERLGFTLGDEVSARTRLADIASSLKPPTPLETAIEIPSRLTLSPHQNAVVLTPPADLFADKDGVAYDFTPPVPEYDTRDVPPETRPTDALWQAKFVTEADGLGLNPGLRAVHSPDLRPGALLSRFADSNSSMPHVEPPGGPFDPWFLSRMQGQTPTMTLDELNALTHLKQKVKNEGGEEKLTEVCDLPNHLRPGIVARLCAFYRTRANPKAYDITRLRGPIDARDRHQLVLLSSAWGLPSIGRRGTSGELTDDSSQFEPSTRSAVWDVMPGSAIYQPKTLNVTELALSSIGGTLRHDTGFQPPAGALFWQDNEPIFDALSIERWQQWTNLGRDIFTEVVYKGFLFPLGMRASIVKVTERIFHFDVTTGKISAPLRQRMFIRVANPEKLFPAIKQPFGGRRFPVRRLNLLTTTTPDIVDPNEDPLTGNGFAVGPHGRIILKDDKDSDSRGIAFWPRMFGAQAGNIRFEMDVDGVKTDLPLIFLDNTAANDPTTVRLLVKYYSDPNHVEHPDLGGPDADKTPVDPLRHLRTLVFGGAERRYSEEVESGGATFQTDHWTLSATGLHDKITERKGRPVEQYSFKSDDHAFVPTLQGADQPPFYPVMEIARVHLTQTERLVGKPLKTVRAQFDARYIANGFSPDGKVQNDSTLLNPAPRDNASEVVLVLRDQHELDMGRKGDQSGGVYRPSGYVAALSRSKGALTQANPIAPPEIRTDVLYSFAARFGLQPKFQIETKGGEPSQSGTAPQNHNPVQITETTSGPTPEAALEEVRKLYKEYLGDNSKILGLVSLRDLIDLIQRLSNPNEGLPDLAEKTEFGAGAVQGVEDAANVIRLQIVAPLAAAVRRIRDGWDAIEEQLNEGQQSIGAPVKPITIAEIFPELDTSLTRLNDALGRAEGETDEIAFALELSACYSAGQQFLGALERAAANPGQRVEEALTKRYTEVLGLFENLERGFEEWLVMLLIGAIQDQLGIPAIDPTNKDFRDQIGAAIGAAVDTAINATTGATTTTLLGEVIRLPRTNGVYLNSDGSVNTTNKKEFEGCLANIVPDRKDLGPIFSALKDFLLSDSQIQRYFSDPPKIEDLLKEFLGSNAKIEFDPGVDVKDTKIGKFFVAADGDFAGYINMQLVDIGGMIGTEIDGSSLPDDEKTALKAEVVTLIDDIGVQIVAASNGVFNTAANDATEALQSGPVRNQIRNRYIACIVLNLLKEKDDCIPKIGKLDARWLRDLLRWLRRLLTNPVDGIPDFEGLFEPIIAFLKRLFDILAALLEAVLKQNYDGLLRILRELFDDIKLPDFGFDLCKALGPAWKGTSFTMEALADLGDVLTPDVVHPDDWTGPFCPFTTSQAKHVSQTGTLPSFSVKTPVSLSGSVFAIRAYSDALLAIATLKYADLQTVAPEVKKHFDTGKATLKDAFEKVQSAFTTLNIDLNADGAEQKYNDLVGFKNEVAETLAGFEESLSATVTCLTNLSTDAGNTHCSLSDSTAAVKALSANLRTASKLAICEPGVPLEEFVEPLIAMTHLPRDVRMADAEIQRLSDNMSALARTLSEKMRDITDRGKAAKGFELLAFVLTGEQLAQKIADLLKKKADDDEIPNKDVAEVKNTLAALKELGDVIDNVTTFLKPLIKSVIETLCQTIRQLDALRAKADDLLDEVEKWIAESENALQGADIPELFRPQMRQLLDDIKAEIDVPRHRANMAKIDQTFETLVEIDKKFCKDENGNHKEVVVDGSTPLVTLNSDNTLADILAAFTGPANNVSLLQDISGEIGNGANRMSIELRQFLEQEPRKAAQKALAPYLRRLLTKSAGVPDSPFTEKGKLSLLTIYETLLDLRGQAYSEIGDLPGGSELQKSFVVKPDEARPMRGDYNPEKFPKEAENADPAANDQLAGDVAWLRVISPASEDNGTPREPKPESFSDELSEQEATFITEFTREWADGDATPIVILRQIVKLVEDILSGDVFKNIDFAAIREEVEDYLLSLVPSKIRMGYDFDIELGSEVAKATAGIFAPKKGTRLGIDMKIVVDLLDISDGDVNIDFRSVGTLGPFDIKLVGEIFDALTLRFASAEFVTEGGSKSDIKIVYTDHKIGPKLKFVEKLQKYLAPKDGSGAIIRFFPNQPGLEAGYRLHLGDFSVGNLAFTNVGLETTAILPFSDSEALFKASLSSRPNPFTLTYAPYGGSGFFGIFATVDGIVGFEASFEFGGSGVFAAGPLSGQGRIMSGVYIRQMKMDGVKITEISMTFFAGGSASIWIFNFAAALSVKLGMINGNMTGEATFSFSFSMGLADFEYSITMVKEEGEGFNGQSASLGTVRTADMGKDVPQHQKQNKNNAIVETAGKCQSQSWKTFKSYFDDDLTLGDYF